MRKLERRKRRLGKQQTANAAITAATVAAGVDENSERL